MGFDWLRGSEYKTGPSAVMNFLGRLPAHGDAKWSIATGLTSVLWQNPELCKKG